MFLGVDKDWLIDENPDLPAHPSGAFLGYLRHPHLSSPISKKKITTLLQILDFSLNRVVLGTEVIVHLFSTKFF